MKQEHMDEIKSYYDKAGVFKRNDRYSGEQGTVYTRAGDNAHWLVMEQKGKNGIEVRLTDENGKITTRDNYEVIGNTIKCTGVDKPNTRQRASLKHKLGIARDKTDNRQSTPSIHKDKGECTR